MGRKLFKWAEEQYYGISMSRMYLVTDVDGTITAGGREVHLGAVSCIRMLERRGVRVILASGNAYPVLMGLKLYLGASGPVIAENGGVIGSGKELKVIGDGRRSRKALSLVLRKFEGEVYESWQNRFRLSDYAVHIKSPLRRESLIAGIRRLLEDNGFRDVEVVDSRVALHIHTVGVSKGNGLRALMEELGVGPENVIAVGDSEVDLSMFEVAGYKVAVGNADPRLKEVADYVTKEGEGTGFVEAVRTLLRKGLL